LAKAWIVRVGLVMSADHMKNLDSLRPTSLRIMR
jgi:hypothetical protein